MKSWRQDAARTRQQDAGAPAAGGSVQGLGYQSPSRLVRLCQTVFYKKIFNHGFRIGGTDKHGWGEGEGGNNDPSMPMDSGGFQRFPINSNHF